ncbi:MAG: acylglycerol kinase family protein, partial [Oscillospiraceae bacterium]
MRHIFIVNPKAGPVNAKDIVLPKLTGQMDKMNLKYEVFVTEYKNHAEEIAKDIVNRGEETQIYVIGGDGTFNEVIRSTRENEKVAVASIPCGSGNDFVRNFTKSNELFFDMKQMAYGNTLTIDLVKVNGSYASSICS